jgi:hypothetical protein
MSPASRLGCRAAFAVDDPLKPRLKTDCKKKVTDVKKAVKDAVFSWSLTD